MLQELPMNANNAFVDINANKHFIPEIFLQVIGVIGW